MRKIIFLVLAAVLLSSFTCAFAFSDTSGHWAESDIERFASLGLARGKGNDSFEPNASITRAEFVAILNRAFPEALSEGDADVLFDDVLADEWFYEDIMAAAYAGLVQGIDEDIFAPQSPITRQDSAVLLARYMKACGFEFADTTQRTFSDTNTISEYAKSAVASLAENAIITGYPDGSVRPGGSLPVRRR